ncbi:NAD(P)-dependent oxidoreductase [Rhizobium laguerreae]|uniref:NAD(P)-dependent oxidoreductase n=1 Tax=Rhizobium laguerreae TaxID=1076926 RepID=UPI0030099F8F
MSKYQTIAFIGFGEAAQAFCEGWGDTPLLTVRAYDVKTADATTADAKRSDYFHYGLVGCETALDAIQEAEAVISLVTADQALAAARDVAAGIAPGTFFFDCNSVAPATKQAAAEAIMTAGARYVDIAVMSPVRPALLAVPLLLSGPFAAEGEQLLADLGFRGRVVEGGVGAASAIKMIRSIMIKGLEALSAECLLSARAAGVEEEVFSSLDASFPGWDWRSRADYNLDRMLVHGLRRAAEMRESAATAAEFGQAGVMASATAEWQERLGALHLSHLRDGFAAKADAILAATGAASQ